MMRRFHRIMIWISGFSACLLWLLSAEAGMAQERIPREFTNPNQMISFDRQTPFPDAIGIISDFVTEMEGRLLINRTGYTGPIGVSLPPMHWRDALQYIIRVQNMVLHENDDFYEVLTQQQLENRTATGDPNAPTSPESQFATTSTREVRINATFFEGSRRALREVGVDWSTLTNLTPDNVADYLSEDGGEQLPTQFDNRFVAVNARGAQNVSQSVFSSLINFGDVGAGIEVQALFSAFEADNLGKILATPSVKVMDGQEGRIQVGEDFSIKQRDFAGNVTDQFFSTGTILTVTPQVIDYQDTTFIYLDLQVERSSAQPDPVSTVISKEQASTHSLLLDGESTVIAGLYRTDQSEVRRGIPILKDLPPWFFGLRYLFGFNSTDISENELIVLVQAELEDSIPNRLLKHFRPKRELIEEQRQRHREDMDYIPSQYLNDEVLEENGRSVNPEPVQPESSVSEVSLSQEGRDQHDISTRSESRNEFANRLEEDMRTSNLNPEAENSVNEPRQTESSQTISADRTATNTDKTNPSGREYSYYTIAGTFQRRDNSEKLYQQLIEEGYDAHLLHDRESSLYRVAYAGFANRREAIRYTLDIQRTQQEDAWLSINSD